jgi:hypothetical protein
VTSSQKHWIFYYKQEYGDDVDPNDFPYESITHDMIGKFGTYLARHAFVYMSEKKGHLSLNTALGYMSAMKSFFLNKFREQPEPAVFGTNSWRAIMAGILGEIVERCKRTGESLVNPKDCIWEGSSSSAEFWHMNREG